MRSFSISICLVAFVLGSGCQSGTSGFRNPFQNPFARAVPDNSTGLVAKSKIDANAHKPDDLDSSEKEDTSQQESPAVASVNPIQDAMEQADHDSKEPLSETEALLSQGDRAFDAEQTPKAAAFYDEVVRMDPTNVHAHHRLAIIADMQKNFDLAESHYTAALKVDPNNLRLLNDLGYSYYLQQNYEESQAYLSYVLQLDSSNTLAMKNLGLVLAAQGNTQEAYALLQKGGLSPTESQNKIQQAIALARDDSANQESSGVASLNSSSHSDSNRIQTTAGEYQFPDHSTTKFEPDSPQDLGNTPRAPVPTRVEKPAGPLNANFSQMKSDRSQQQNHDSQDYLLERAALNTGFGNLFPITSADEYHRAQQARPVSWEHAPSESADARRAYYEQFGNPQHGSANIQNAHHVQPSSAGTPNFYRSLQAPIQQTTLPIQSPGPENRYAVPVTQPSFHPQSPAQYDQFPEGVSASPAPNANRGSVENFEPTFGSPSQDSKAQNSQNPPQNALREYQQGLQELESSPFNQPQYR